MQAAGGSPLGTVLSDGLWAACVCTLGHDVRSPRRDKVCSRPITDAPPGAGKEGDGPHAGPRRYREVEFRGRNGG